MFFLNCAGQRRAAPTRAAFASDQSSSSHAEFKLKIDRVSGAFFCQVLLFQVSLEK